MTPGHALVIGAGPAGMMAAGELARAGLRVTLADAMPTVGRKFLMAGKSGLNLTKDEPLADFLSAYGPVPPKLEAALRDFGPTAVMDWARALGQPVFTGSSGRVFPLAMKASPLLRAWLGELAGLGVTVQTRWRWQGWDGAASVFSTPAGNLRVTPDVTVLAMGGSSWARLGSDGTWVMHLPGLTLPFRPANMGFRIDWSPRMAVHFGKPVKGTALIAGEQRARAEFVLSSRGIEGGGVYAVSRAVRDGVPLSLDLMPDMTVPEMRARLARAAIKDTMTNRLRKALGLDPVRIALVHEFGRPFPGDLAPLIKALPVPHGGPRPLDEAISTAGGLDLNALDDGLMIRDRPGVFAAGEMLDWEAPTGGYLITACLATGRWAGRAAAHWASERYSAPA